METLQQKTEVLQQGIRLPDEGQFTATMCLIGTHQGECFEDGSVAQVGALLWGTNFSKKFLLSGSSRYHPPVRAKMINLIVAESKAQGAYGLKVKDSGLDNHLYPLLAARKRSGLNANGKPLKGYEELNQVQTHIDEGFLKLEMPWRGRNYKTPDTLIAQMVAQRVGAIGIYE